MAVSGVQPVVQVSQANTETTAFTIPGTGLLTIATASLTNTTSAAVTVNLSLVANGTAAGTSNRIVSAYSLGAGDTLSLANYLGGAVMGPGDKLTQNFSATGVNLLVTGTFQSV